MKVFTCSLIPQRKLILQNAPLSAKSTSQPDWRSNITCFLSLSFPSEHENISILCHQGTLTSLGSRLFLAFSPFHLFQDSEGGRGENNSWLWS
jgi:hypothetical protein